MSSEAGDDPKRSREPIPRGPRRREQIAAVAEEVFLEHGFADTRMQTIADLAGASKETLYRHFRSKDDLLIEIVESRARRLKARLEARLEATAGIAAILREIGINLLEAMNSADVIQLLRIVVAETVRNPDLGQALYAAGPEHTNRRLTAYLEDAGAHGEFAGDDAALAASLFIGSVLGNTLLYSLIRPTERPMTQAEIARRVDASVSMFMARHHGAGVRS